MKRVLKKFALITVSMLCFTACINTEEPVVIDGTTSVMTVETKTKMETTMAITTAVTTITTIESTTDETVSVPKYELNPSVTYTADAFGNEDYVNVPMYLGTPEGSEANVYVMLSDDTRLWEHKTSNHIYDSREYVVIEHDGVIDEMPCSWSSADDSFKFYYADYDSDGVQEIALVTCAACGMYTAEDELHIFDEIDGHYQAFSLDNGAVISEYFSDSIDNERHTIIINVKGYDTPFLYDISEIDSEVTELSYQNVVGYRVEDGKIKVGFLLLMLPVNSIDPLDGLSVSFDVNLSDGKFSLCNPNFSEDKYIANQKGSYALIYS